MVRIWRIGFALSACVAPLSPLAASAQPDFTKVEIRTERVAEGLYMLKGAGGNLGVSAEADGVFLIDDQFAPLTEKIKAAIGAISEQPIRFALNTHWHGDHTGGNENLAGAGVLIVAHDNVRRRMSAEQFIAAMDRKVPPSPEKALPVVTFTDSVTFHLNGEEVVVFHVAPAHTDGDAIVHFRKANVVHMGDCFWSGGYPLIDVSTGGSINGMIAAAGRVLRATDAGTKFIPGHGDLGDRARLEAFQHMLESVRDRVRKQLAAGKALKEVVDSKPTADLDAHWGGAMNPDKFVEIVYGDLARK